MEKEFIESCDLMNLKSILDEMIKQSRIKADEAELLLNKAGLTHINENEWVDERSAKYKFE